MAEKANLSLKEKLKRVQIELKAPKNLYNSFGKYHYRNAEGIQEALKPMEKTYEFVTILSDEIVEVGGRVYVKATATISDATDSISVTAYAREASDKKGMDDAQVTGATSSYARKYALNGLFLLDDTKDVDTEEYQEVSKRETKTTKAEPAPAAAPTTKPNYRSMLHSLIKDFNLDQNSIIKLYGLHRESTDDEFKAAFEYAKGLVKDMQKGENA